MTIALVTVAKDAARTIGVAFESARPFVDTWTLLDTGSRDRTPEVAEEAMDGLPGRVLRQPWEGFARARTAALAEAKGTADWLLQMDADMTLEAHPGLRSWLADEPDPGPDPLTAWSVEIVDGSLSWRLPWMVRGDMDWEYQGEAHAHQVSQGRIRPLLGLKLYHHGDYKLERFEENIESLAAGVAAGDARSVYYTAQALRALSRDREAIEMYSRRANMGGFEEEAWHAQYMAARMAEDLEGLFAAYRRRPWRHEPLTWAGRIVAKLDSTDDLLFQEILDG